MSIVTDLLADILAFVADVLLFRRQRGNHGRAARSMEEDAVAVAHFEFFTVLWISLVSVGLMLILIFAFDVPVLWGVGIGTTVGGLWGYRRYSQLLRER